MIELRTRCVCPFVRKVGQMPKSYRGTFLKRGRWWVAWSDDVPGALTQGRTLSSAKRNLSDAIKLMREPLDTSPLEEGGRCPPYRKRR